MSTEVTIEDRVARALLVGNRWADNLEANAVQAHTDRDYKTMDALNARARDIRDLLAILRGDEDLYIAHLKNRKER